MSERELTVTELGTRIFEESGGMANISSITHCMTRVRMNVRDADKVNADGLKVIPGVLGVVEGEQLQVVIGPGKVDKVAKAMADQAGVALGEEIPSAEINGKDAVMARATETKVAQKAKQKQSPLKSLLKDISNIFVPMIPAFVGAGLVAGIASVMTNLITAGTIDGDTWNYYVMILNVLKNGMFSYLVIFTGINGAQVFGANPTLGGVIGSVVLLTGMDPEAPILNTLTGADLTAGQGGIIGVIFAVWLLAKIENMLHKVVPDAIDIIITPTISLLVVGLIEIFLIMPLAGFVSDGLVGVINWVLNVGGPFAGFVLGATFLPMVMLGLHQILTPIHIQMIDMTGSTQLLPILAMAGAGQVGAALALWFKLRHDKQLSEMIKGALPVGILGIGEPLIYGVTLPLGRPFITACIGGGVGGAVIGAMANIGATAIGPSGIALLPLITNAHWLGYCLGLLAGYAGGFIATYFFGIPKDRLTSESVTETTQSDSGVQETASSSTVSETISDAVNTVNMYAAASGQLHTISESSDPVFSQKMMGDGYYIVPDGGDIYSPVSGTVTMISPTKHAIGITTQDGLEILLHMGIDTVDLAGKPFNILVQEDQQVTANMEVAEVDLEELKINDKKSDIIVVITNMDVITHASEVIDKVVSNEEVVMTVELNRE